MFLVLSILILRVIENINRNRSLLVDCPENILCE